MNKYIIGIDGMMCGMCEMHVESKIKESFVVKKAKASHITNKVVVITEANLIEDDFKAALDPAGYRVTSFEKQAAKKTILGWK